MSRNAVDKFQSFYQGEKVYTKLVETLESERENKKVNL